MSNPLTEVADAIAAEFNAAAAAGAFGAGFAAIQAKRSYADEDMLLKQGGVLRVDVVPAAWVTDIFDRGAVRQVVGCDLGFRFKFDADFQDAETGRIDNAPIDELVELLNQAAEYFMPATATGDPRRLSDLPEAVWESTDVRAAFVPKHLREMQQYTGIVRIAYSVIR